MVAVWADNGNLNDYLKSDAGLKLSVTDRFLLVGSLARSRPMLDLIPA